MDRLVNELIKLGWKRLDEENEGDTDDKSWLFKGRWRCVVGSNWTTFYKMVNRNKIGDMRSTSTVNDGEILKLAKRLVA